MFTHYKSKCTLVSNDFFILILKKWLQCSIRFQFPEPIQNVIFQILRLLFQDLVSCRRRRFLSFFLIEYMMYILFFEILYQANLIFFVELIPQKNANVKIDITLCRKIHLLVYISAVCLLLVFFRDYTISYSIDMAVRLLLLRVPSNNSMYRNSIQCVFWIMDFSIIIQKWYDIFGKLSGRRNLPTKVLSRQY